MLHDIGSFSWSRVANAGLSEGVANSMSTGFGYLLAEIVFLSGEKAAFSDLPLRKDSQTKGESKFALKHYSVALALLILSLAIPALELLLEQRFRLISAYSRLICVFWIAFGIALISNLYRSQSISKSRKLFKTALVLISISMLTLGLFDSGISSAAANIVGSMLVLLFLAIFTYFKKSFYQKLPSLFRKNSEK